MRVGPFFVLSLLLASISAVVSDQSEDRDVRERDSRFQIRDGLLQDTDWPLKEERDSRFQIRDSLLKDPHWHLKHIRENVCKTDGELCKEDDECCVGYCTWDNLVASHVCDIQENVCKADGELCKSSGECCSEHCPWDFVTNRGICEFPEYGCKAGGDLCEIDDDCCSLYCKWDDATEHSVCDVNPLLRTWMKKTQQIGYQDFEYGCKTDGMLCERDDECCSLYQCTWDYITYRNECGYP
ncbi:uncharacterized protein LOC143274945 isoform X2 [Babylonia areolata]|uniref:uncharacterized protein LOC143274945 isoform X2 n=1 Tax=Babylonia areolata TaxID=304850 RepID=UPI003FD0AB1B